MKLSSLRQLLDEFPTEQQYPDSRWRRGKIFLRRLIIYTSELIYESSMSRLNRKNSVNFLNKYDGEVLLLGNGPSIKNLTKGQINYFKNMGGRVACVNDMFKSEMLNVLKPDLYFMIDPYYWNYNNLTDTNILLEKFLLENPNCLLVQPSNQPNLSSRHSSYAYLDTRTSLFKSKKSMKAFSRNMFSYSVILLAMLALKDFGFRRIYLAGVESDFYKHIQIDHLNRLHLNLSSYSGIATESKLNDILLQDENGLPILGTPLRNMKDALHSFAYFLNDFQIVAENCINVGHDLSNDLLPRASLMKNLGEE